MVSVVSASVIGLCIMTLLNITKIMREVSFASAESFITVKKHYRNLVLEIDITCIYILIGFNSICFAFGILYYFGWLSVPTITLSSVIER
jgi:hypothetical protein